MSVHQQNKALLKPLFEALYHGEALAIEQALARLFHKDAAIRLGAPVGEITGPDALWARAYQPLLESMPNLEKRDFITMAGPRWGEGREGNWVGVGGNFIGSFARPWLGIPATGRPIFMRYHEYYRIEDGKIVEMEGLWDIPQVMMQAGVWPMGAQAGVEWMCPGPAEQHQCQPVPADTKAGEAAVQVVWDMLHEFKKADATHIGRGLGGYWHANALWYGPAGIGSGRGHQGIIDTVLKGFRTGLSDNIRFLEEGVFFAEGNLVAFTGWPSGEATHSGDGFLGLAPTDKRFTRRSLDFWRVEDGLIRENWVMVDMIDIYVQLGLNIFEHMADRAIKGVA